ncbi:hypothetical protein QWY93_18760 [Echinicola jeungdonensis]|uniref:hypothetical protein n=1 Tax=Echinicola jeungdonensis TaxID=709343 RepID=UPI0025B40A1A|nr:hypothetical protein [Echinicola jeungdonensis]MDN3671315.1 hypothetical protein [Echinicola jeungdonensis]
MISREILDQEGQFGAPRSTPLDFTPKAIYYEEVTNTLLFIPEEPGINITLVNINPTRGSFGSHFEIQQSAGPETIEGVVVSPNTDYFYYSQGDQILRVPASGDFDGTPEAIPLNNPVENVYDLKFGPDGKLYYIYQEENSDAFLVGTVNNPEEEDLLNVEVDEDPFQGTDFCGSIFPHFAPDMDGISGTVDFSWSPNPLA